MEAIIIIGTVGGVLALCFTDNFFLAFTLAGYFERAVVEGWKIIRHRKPGKFDWFTARRSDSSPACYTLAMARNLTKQPRRNAAVVDEVRTEAELEALFPPPRTPLVEAALRARREYLRTGGRLLSLEEINAQVREQRGGHEYDE